MKDKVFSQQKIRLYRLDIPTTGIDLRIRWIQGNGGCSRQYEAKNRYKNLAKLKNLVHRILLDRRQKARSGKLWQIVEQTFLGPQVAGNDLLRNAASGNQHPIDPL